MVGKMVDEMFGKIFDEMFHEMLWGADDGMTGVPKSALNADT